MSYFWIFWGGQNCLFLRPAVLIILVIIVKGVSPWLISLLSLSGYNLPPVYNLIWQDLEGWEVVTPYFPGSDGPENYTTIALEPVFAKEVLFVPGLL